MTQLTTEELLHWHIEAGVDEVVGETPLNRYNQAVRDAKAVNVAETVQGIGAGMRAPFLSSKTESGAKNAVLTSENASGAAAREIAFSCNSLDELKQALMAYDGCALSKTCRQTVFSDGNPDAGVMVVGEAPGADEDRIGRPFVGASGKLLDLMLASIGLDRTGVYIANLSPWRPPGNRKPEQAEVEILRPFLQRHIILAKPRVLLLLGGSAANALLGRHDALSRIRGRWHDYQTGTEIIPALPSFHPAYLLRTPAHKRLAWIDFLMLSKKINQEQPRV